VLDDRLMLIPDEMVFSKECYGTLNLAINIDTLDKLPPILVRAGYRPTPIESTKMKISEIQDAGMSSTAISEMLILCNCEPFVDYYLTGMWRNDTVYTGTVPENKKKRAINVQGGFQKWMMRVFAGEQLGEAYATKIEGLCTAPLKLFTSTIKNSNVVITHEPYIYNKPDEWALYMHGGSVLSRSIGIITKLGVVGEQVYYCDNHKLGLEVGRGEIERYTRYGDLMETVPIIPLTAMFNSIINPQTMFRGAEIVQCKEVIVFEIKDTKVSSRTEFATMAPKFLDMRPFCSEDAVDTPLMYEMTVMILSVGEQGTWTTYIKPLNGFGNYLTVVNSKLSEVLDKTVFTPSSKIKYLIYKKVF